LRTPSDYARDAIAAVVRDARIPVRFTTVRLTKRPSSVAARADVEVNGQMVHASASAVHPRDAVDLLAGELRKRLEWLSARGE
jgi:ribosome-associated translation inhibitor RaiA